MDELDAINKMLSLIAETPLASLDEVDGVADAQTAQQILTDESRNCQSLDWEWNTEECYPLAADQDGNVPLPPNTLDVDPTDPLLDYVERAGKLYDRANHTFNIGKTVNVTLRLMLTFDDLPQAAKNYIATIAGRKFENRIQGDSLANKINDDDVTRAFSVLLEKEAENAGLNVIRNSPSQSIRTRFREVW